MHLNRAEGKFAKYNESNRTCWSKWWFYLQHANSRTCKPFVHTWNLFCRSSKMIVLLVFRFFSYCVYPKSRSPGSRCLKKKSKIPCKRCVLAMFLTNVWECGHIFCIILLANGFLLCSGRFQRKIHIWLRWTMFTEHVSSVYYKHHKKHCTFFLTMQSFVKPM